MGELIFMSPLRPCQVEPGVPRYSTAGCCSGPSHDWRIGAAAWLPSILVPFVGILARHRHGLCCNVIEARRLSPAIPCGCLPARGLLRVRSLPVSFP